jgi:hypothetical protein
MLNWLGALILGAVFALGGYVTYRHNATVPAMQQLGYGVHNLWHPDYPAEIP